MRPAFKRLAPPGTPWTLEELMEAGRRLGCKPTMSNTIPHGKVIARLCGGLRQYQEALGYTANGKGRPRKGAV